jgi:hypothetical protein
MDLTGEELFLYLGKRSHVLFFFHLHHVARDEDGLGQMCCDVYNTLIQFDSLDIDDKVVVFNLDVSPTTDGQIQPVYVDHVTFATMQFPEGAIAQTFVDLFAAERPHDQEMLVIKALLNGGKPACYQLCTLPNSSAMQTYGPKFVKRGSPKLKELICMVSIKPFQQ